MLAEADRRQASRPTRELLFGETDESNPFVHEEQMMPFVPFVRVPATSMQAIDLAQEVRARLPAHGHHPLAQRATT